MTDSTVAVSPEAYTPLTVKNVLTDRRIAEVRRIYIQSFPAEERMPFPMMTAMSLLWNTRLLSFYDGETLCGMVYAADLLGMTFVMFFAVDEKLRSRGYGSRILRTLADRKPGRKLVLSIEPCEDSAPNQVERLRRKSFYLRNGYKETGYMTRLAGQTQEILSRDGDFSPWQFRWFFILYSVFTMYPRVWKITDK